MLRNAVEGVCIPGKKCYEGVRFSVVSVTRGWVGVKFPGKKRYVTLELPIMRSFVSLFFRMKMFEYKRNPADPVKRTCTHSNITDALEAGAPLWRQHRVEKSSLAVSPARLL